MKKKKLVKCERCQELKGTPELHSCPYQCEINDDHEEACNCCEECSDQCVMDI